MKHQRKLKEKQNYVGIRVSRAARDRLSAIAKQDRRTMIAALDLLLGL